MIYLATSHIITSGEFWLAATAIFMSVVSGVIVAVWSVAKIDRRIAVLSERLKGFGAEVGRLTDTITRIDDRVDAHAIQLAHLDQSASNPSMPPHKG